jgi:cellobiose phosphorylase
MGAESRDTALALAEKYQNHRMADRLFDLAWTHSQVTLRHLDATEADAQLYGRLAGALVYANSGRRAGPAVLLNNRRGQSGLWGYGISGDLPIVLLRISDPDKMDIVRRLVQAHAYWRMKELPVELVILNEDLSITANLCTANRQFNLLGYRGTNGQTGALCAPFGSNLHGEIACCCNRSRAVYYRTKMGPWPNKSNAVERWIP